MRAARDTLRTKGATGVDNLHMEPMFLTCPTFHWDTSPLNDEALWTVAEVEGGEDVRAGTRRAQHGGGAAGVDNSHIKAMFLTCPTFHREMSALKSDLSKNR